MKGMRLAILGSGSALPDPERGNPSQAVVIDDQCWLIDCGERTTVNLTKAGINPLAVDCLFFTHLHWDHISDYGYLVMTSWNCGRTSTLQVFGPAGTRQMSEATIYGAHRADVEYVRSYRRALPAHILDRPAEDPPVEVQEIEAGFVYERGGSLLLAADVEHHQRLGMPSLGFRIESPYGIVAISGDTRPCQATVDLARGADVLVHDCAFLEEIIRRRQMWSHSGPAGAGRVAREAGVGKLVLTHLGPYTSAAAAVEMAEPYYGPKRDEGIWKRIVQEAQQEFSGPVVLGRDGLVIEVGSESRTDCDGRSANGKGAP